MQSIVPKDYSYEISSLEKLITTIQTNVYFTITIIIALLALAIGIAGWALAVLVKARVEKSIEKEIGLIEDKIKSFSMENPQLLWARGDGILISSTLGDEGNYITHKYQMIGLKDFKKDNVIYIDAYYLIYGEKVPINDYDVQLKDTGIEVKITKNDTNFHPNFQVHVFALWSNPIYNR